MFGRAERKLVKTKTKKNESKKEVPFQQKKLSSARFDKYKKSNPFAEKKNCKTEFGRMYERGEIPCFVKHNTASLQLCWKEPINTLDYDPLLILCVEGIIEDSHPLVFVSRTAVRDLCQCEGSYNKVIPLLKRVVQALRSGLISNNPDIFNASLDAICHISDSVRDYFNPFLKLILTQISKRSLDKRHEKRIFEVLQVLNENGCSEEVSKLIKSKVPTFTSFTAREKLL